MLPWVAKLFFLGNPGIAFGTSRMQSGRSFQLIPQNTFIRIETYEWNYSDELDLKIYGIYDCGV